MKEMQELTAAYYTLGCKLNFAESSTVGKMLADRGVRRADEGETPDVCVVNTCSVTETADKKGRQLIKRLSRQFPDAVIVVTGCYAQLKTAEVAAIEGVDIVVGANDKLQIARYLDRWLQERRAIVDVSELKGKVPFMPSCERGDRTRWFLKVQDGCDYFCTYCTIPYARGRSRSGSIDDIVAQARDVADKGAREIVITGVNIGDFGHGTDQTLFDLIRRLDGIESVERFRISSIEPNLLTPEIIRWVAGESRAFMPHFHVPLQSGSDKVLKMMNRRYDTALFADRMAMIKDYIPDAFIGIDLMTGARGETPEEWERSYRFVESLPVTRMHVFPYSERPGTAALKLPDAVEPAEKSRRVALLTELSERKLHSFMSDMIGTERPVLWENAHPGGVMHGLTDNYIRVAAPLHEDMFNMVSRVRLDGFDPKGADLLIASLI